MWVNCWFVQFLSLLTTLWPVCYTHEIPYINLWHHFLSPPHLPSSLCSLFFLHPPHPPSPLLSLFSFLPSPSPSLLSLFSFLPSLPLPSLPPHPPPAQKGHAGQPNLEVWDVQLTEKVTELIQKRQNGWYSLFYKVHVHVYIHACTCIHVHVYASSLLL